MPSPHSEETHDGMDDDLRPEYDLSRLLRDGVRGRYAARYHATDRVRINIDPDNTARSRCLFQSVKDDHG